MKINFKLFQSRVLVTFLFSLLFSLINNTSVLAQNAITVEDSYLLHR